MPQGIRNVFHALALNEKRRDFKPLIFADPPQGVTLRQCWFLGAHGNVGGGYDDFALSNVSLAWMIAQLATHTALRTADVSSQLAPRLLGSQATTEIPLARGILNEPSDTNQVRRVADIACRDPLEFRRGRVGESYKSFYKASGAQPRAIQYLNKAKDWIMDKQSSKSPPSSPSAAISNDPPVEPPVEPPPAQRATPDSLAEDDKVDIGREQTIHFTVRLVLDKNYGGTTCPVLSDYTHILEPGSNSFVWRRKSNVAKDPKEPDDMYEMMEVSEDKPSLKELALLRILGRCEAKVLEEERRSRLKYQALVTVWVKEYGELGKFDDGNTVSPFGMEIPGKEHERREELGELVRRWADECRAWAENPALAQRGRITLVKFLQPFMEDMEGEIKATLTSSYVQSANEIEWRDKIKNIVA